MTKRCLFNALASLANDLQAECERLVLSPEKLVLLTIVERVDLLIDTVLEEGVIDDA